MVWLIKANFIVTCMILIFIMWQDIFFRRITHTSLVLLAISLLSLILLQSHLPNILFGLIALVGGFTLLLPAYGVAVMPS